MCIEHHALQGKCSCWAGYSGATCSTNVSRPNQCNALVGINLEGALSCWVWQLLSLQYAYCTTMTECPKSAVYVKVEDVLVI
jgi:hypothetical protein